MSLLLTIYASPAWEVLAQNIGLTIINDKSAISSEKPSLLLPVQQLSALHRLLSEMPAGGCLWIAVVQAEHFIADSIQAVGSLKEAAILWQEQTKGILKLQSQHRRQVKLFNVHQALSEPVAFREYLNPTIKINNYPKQAFTDLNLLLSAQYVHQQADLQRLKTQLQASSLPLCDNEAPILDIDQIFQLDQAKEVELSATREERDLILLQLQRVQEQLENYYLDLQIEKKKALVHDNLLREGKARAASAEYSSEILQQELDRIQSNILWKVAAPLRAFRRITRKHDTACVKTLRERVALLLASKYFDTDWYINSYPDVADSEMNPAEHYLRFGASEGRLPSALFDGNWYLQQYPDVANAGMNPLLHFIMFGQQEGRNIHPVINQSQFT